MKFQRNSFWQIGAAALALVAMAASASAATITGRLVDISGDPTVTNIVISPVSKKPLLVGTNMAVGTSTNLVPSTNGVFGVKLSPGFHYATIGRKEPVILWVPDDEATYPITSLITNAAALTNVEPQFEIVRKKDRPGGYVGLDVDGRLTLSGKKVTQDELVRVKYLELNVCAPPYNASTTTNIDSTSAFQRAIDDAWMATTGNGANSARGGVVYVPPGNYRITDTVEHRAGVRFHCASEEGVAFHTWCVGKPAFKYDDGRENFSNASLWMGNFSMINHVTNSGPAIYLDGTFGPLWLGGTSFMLENVTVYDYTEDGTVSFGNMDSIWHGVKAVRSGKNGHFFSTDSFNTSSSFHLSSLACGEFGVRGVAAYSEFYGSADANKFGGWRFDTGTALRFAGGGEFNFSNALDAQYVFGMKIDGGVFLTLATNTFSAVKLDTCFGVTISGCDIGGGSGGSPTDAAAPFWITNSSGVYIQANTYWEKWRGSNFIIHNGGVTEGINYAKTTARQIYAHRLLEKEWELKADGGRHRLNTFTDSSNEWVFASQDVDRMSVRRDAVTHDLHAYSYLANSNAWTVKYDGSTVRQHWPVVFERGLLIGTTTPQADPFYVKGGARFIQDNSFLKLDTEADTSVGLMWMSRGQTMWEMKMSPFTQTLLPFSYQRYRHFTGLGQDWQRAYNQSFPFLLDGQNGLMTVAWPLIVTNTFAIRGHNGRVGYVWTLTNEYTFEGEWRSVGSVSGTVTTADLVAASQTTSNALQTQINGLTGGANLTDQIGQRQFGSANLTNWSALATGAVVRVQDYLAGSNAIVSGLQSQIDNLAAFNGASMGDLLASTNTVTTNIEAQVQQRQFGSANLTNWSALATGAVVRVPDYLAGSNAIVSGLQSQIDNLAAFNGASMTDLQTSTNDLAAATRAQLLAASNAVVVWATNLVAASQVTFPTNGLVCADTVAVNVDTNAAPFQTLQLDRASVTLNTANRNVRTGASTYNLEIYGQPAAPSTITCNAAWRVHGTNKWFTVPAGGSASMSFKVSGTLETNVTVMFSVMQ